MRDLATLRHRELLDLFAVLDAPELNELDGEYARLILAQKFPGERAFAHATVSNPRTGHWLGKAFNGGTDGQVGQGYNYFRKRGRIVHTDPMLTTIAPSRFDGRPSFQLVYRAFHSLCGSIHMVDELRTVGPGQYLGLGTYGFTTRQRMHAIPFQLTGPDAPYSGDTGRSRTGFDLAAALKP